VLFHQTERLLALLHGHTVYKETLKGRPSSLADIDYHFWTSDYSSWNTLNPDDIDSVLIPAVGGFLGSLLVTHLGGRWVPRRVLTESYVALGDRAWLPFLRARRYLENTQAVLDYSLSKFYREAERYAHSLGHAR
jgi:hypothetical protein